MRARKIYVTERDMEQLRKLIEEEKRLGKQDRPDLQELTDELDRAKLITTEKVPDDVITMNSKVHLKDLDSGEELTYTLVFPERANIEKDRISVLAPIGVAILGYSVGDTFEWEVPGGVRHLKVEEVLYQPEASGE